MALLSPKIVALVTTGLGGTAGSGYAVYYTNTVTTIVGPHHKKLPRAEDKSFSNQSTNLVLDRQEDNHLHSRFTEERNEDSEDESTEQKIKGKTIPS